MKIKARKFSKGDKFEIITKGDWIDLRAAEDVTFVAPHVNKSTKEVVFDSKLIKLGVAMKLPKGFEAMLLPRSGTFKAFHIICSNSEGVIDNSYSGNMDEWKFAAIAFAPTTIPEGARICQFRIQLSQKATMWQKLKWLFSSKIEVEWVDNLDDNNRGGFGSTGSF